MSALQPTHGILSRQNSAAMLRYVLLWELTRALGNAALHNGKHKRRKAGPRAGCVKCERTQRRVVLVYLVARSVL